MNTAQSMNNPTGLSGLVRFDQVPHTLLATTVPAPVKYTPEPGDKGLATLLKPFVAVDNVRPAMGGHYVDPKAARIVVTDGHRLVLLPTSSKRKGLYSPDGKGIDERFPDYENAIPTPEFLTKGYGFSTRALRSYLSAALAFVNPRTTAVCLRIEQGQGWIWVNAKQLMEDLLFFERLGHTTLYAYFNENKRLILTPKSVYGGMTEPMILQMGLGFAFGKDEDTDNGWYAYRDGATYADRYALIGYWSFAQNTVVLAGARTPPRFEEKTGLWNHRPTPSDQLPGYVFNALKASTSKMVPITEYVYKQQDTIQTTDLHLSYTHQNGVLSALPDGLYRMEGKALLPVSENPLDYPTNANKPLNVNHPTRYVMLPAGAFKGLLPFASTELMRPSMLGINLKLVAKSNRIEAAATNGNALSVAGFLSQQALDDGTMILPPLSARLHELMGVAGQLSFTDAAHQIQYPSDMIRASNINERYPVYADAFSDAYAHRYTLDVARLRSAITALPKGAKGSLYNLLLTDDTLTAQLMIEERINTPGKSPRTVWRPAENAPPLPLPGIVGSASGPYSFKELDGVLLMPVLTQEPGVKIGFAAALFKTTLDRFADDGQVYVHHNAPNKGAYVTVAGGGKTPQKSVAVRAKAPATAPAPDPRLLLRARALALTLVLELELARYSL